MLRHIVPDIVNKQIVRTVTADEMVTRSAEIMTMFNISAILVVEDDNPTKLIGLMSSNDLTQRVVAAGLDPKTTTVGEIMTKDVFAVAPSHTARDALNIMRDHRCRHLPVIDGETLVGIVSIRDLYAAIDLDLQDDLSQTRSYITGVNEYSRS